MRITMTRLVAVFALFALVGSGAAYAGKVTASISLPSARVAAPAAGSQVTFDVRASASRESDLYSLWVANKCYQNGVNVYAEYLPVRDGHAGPFTLSWNGGAADCVAYVWMHPESEKPLRNAVVNYSAAG